MTQELTAYVADRAELAPAASACNSIQGDVNTFDLSTNEGKLATLKTLNSADSLNGHEGEILDIVDCVTKPGIRKSRDPRLPNTACTDTYLVLKDGTVLMSQSEGVASSVREIAAMFADFGKNSLPDGCIHCAFVAKDLPNGNTIKNLVPQF